MKLVDFIGTWFASSSELDVDGMEAEDVSMVRKAEVAGLLRRIEGTCFTSLTPAGADLCFGGEGVEWGWYGDKGKRGPLSSACEAYAAAHEAFEAGERGIVVGVMDPTGLVDTVWHLGPH